MSGGIDKVGTCALCLTRDIQLCNSHIIPEFLYNLPEDQAERNELRLWSSDRASHPKRRPVGVYDRLLCRACEDRFQKLEDYASLLLYDEDGRVKVMGHDLGMLFEFCGVDYKQFKLFLLSMLWRLSVSRSHDFKAVQLGDHEERLRSMLLGDDPGEWSSFGCVISYCPLLRQRHPEIDFREMAVFPELIGGPEEYPKIRMVFGGLYWQYHITLDGLDKSIEPLFVGEDGVLRIPKLGEDALLFIYQAVADVFDWRN